MEYVSSGFLATYEGGNDTVCSLLEGDEEIGGFAYGTEI